MSRAGRALLVWVSVSIRDSKLPNVRSLVGYDVADDADMILIVMICDSLIDDYDDDDDYDSDDP